MVIGLAGRNAAGKGEVARFLNERSFRAHSLSDEIRRALEADGLPVTRESMIERGREIRGAEGPGALAERIRRRLDPLVHHVVDSIRHPAEVRALRALPDFLLLAIEAPQEIRFQRVVARARTGDPTTLEQFRALEAREEGAPAGDDPTAQQLLATLALADHRLVNEGSIEDLQQQVLALVRDHLAGTLRPSWDRYFMDIAMEVASRSNCLKRKVAAVIVKDRRIVSTGYNGTPRGVRNCNEGGCPRCAGLAAEGTRLGECVCSHGEENAIVQAAYHGVSLKGTTLYSTFSPCLLCAKMIINSGIVEVIYRDDYPLGETAAGILAEAGITVRKLAAGV